MVGRLTIGVSKSGTRAEVEECIRLYGVQDGLADRSSSSRSRQVMTDAQTMRNTGDESGCALAESR